MMTPQRKSKAAETKTAAATHTGTAAATPASAAGSLEWQETAAVVKGTREGVIMAAITVNKSEPRLSLFISKEPPETVREEGRRRDGVFKELWCLKRIGRQREYSEVCVCTYRRRLNTTHCAERVTRGLQGLRSRSKARPSLNSLITNISPVLSLSRRLCFHLQCLAPPPPAASRPSCLPPPPVPPPPPRPGAVFLPRQHRKEARRMISGMFKAVL